MLNKLVSKFKVKAPVATANNDGVSKYIKKMQAIKFNYIYDYYCLNGSTKFAVVENQAIDKKELNEDIIKLRSISNTAVTIISYSFDDIRSMLYEGNQPDYYIESNGYNVYINKDKSNIYETEDLLGYIEKSIDVPSKLVGLDQNNNTKSFIIGAKSNNIKIIGQDTHRSTTVIGEYFGVVKIKSSNEVYFIYGIGDIYDRSK